mmetsp:Transcript_65158/g.121460  ORF Transcript_65158/g.121460 Transcript_65158/m.121460 type:complete len:712 (-) Transcript_65158:48-2183(-)
MASALSASDQQENIHVDDTAWLEQGMASLARRLKASEKRLSHLAELRQVVAGTLPLGTLPSETSQALETSAMAELQSPRVDESLEVDANSGCRDAVELVKQAKSSIQERDALMLQVQVADLSQQLSDAERSRKEVVEQHMLCKAENAEELKQLQELLAQQERLAQVAAESADTTMAQVSALEKEASWLRTELKEGSTRAEEQQEAESQTANESDKDAGKHAADVANLRRMVAELQVLLQTARVQATIQLPGRGLHKKTACQAVQTMESATPLEVAELREQLASLQDELKQVQASAAETLQTVRTELQDATAAEAASAILTAAADARAEHSEKATQAEFDLAKLSMAKRLLHLEGELGAAQLAQAQSEQKMWEGGVLPPKLQTQVSLPAAFEASMLQKLQAELAQSRAAEISLQQRLLEVDAKAQAKELQARAREATLTQDLSDEVKLVRQELAMEKKGKQAAEDLYTEAKMAADECEQTMEAREQKLLQELHQQRVSMQSELLSEQAALLSARSELESMKRSHLLRPDAFGAYKSVANGSADLLGSARTDGSMRYGLQDLDALTAKPLAGPSLAAVEVSPARSLAAPPAAAFEDPIAASQARLFGRLPEPYAQLLKRVELYGWTSVNWKDGFSMLHWAAKRGNTPLCRYLVQLDADPNARDVNSDAPLDFAVAGGHSETVGFLEQLSQQPLAVSAGLAGPTLGLSAELVSA